MQRIQIFGTFYSQKVHFCSCIFKFVLSNTDKIINKGLSSKFTDFEDALQYHCAIKMDCKILITRNEKDFKESEIPVMTPDEYLNSLTEK